MPFRPITLDLDINIHSRGKPEKDAEGMTFVEADTQGKINWRTKVGGSIRHLEIKGHAIELNGESLNDGLLSTTRFGNIEVVSVSDYSEDVELRATLEQIRSIRIWLDQQQEHFEYEGMLIAIVVPATYDVSTVETDLFLEVDNIQYRLLFHGNTSYNNVESSELGELWHTGGRYGINGVLDGETIRVDSIAYLDET